MSQIVCGKKIINSGTFNTFQQHFKLESQNAYLLLLGMSATFHMRHWMLFLYFSCQALRKQQFSDDNNIFYICDIL